MASRSDSRRGGAGALGGTLAGIFVILAAAVAGVLSLMGLDVSLAYKAGIESLVVAIAGLGWLLVRVSREGKLYRHLSEVSSSDRRLSLLLVLPTVASAVFCAVSGVNLDVILTLEATLVAMVLILTYIARAGKGGM